MVDPFYSHAEKTIHEKLPDSIKPLSARNILRKHGVTDDEMQWSGLHDHLTKADPNSQVSKGDLLNTVRNNSKLPKEVIKDLGPGDLPPGHPQYDDPDPSNSTKFSDPNYQLPGGTNYKEMLFQLPVNLSRDQRISARDAAAQKIMSQPDYPEDLPPLNFASWARENHPDLYHVWSEAGRLANLRPSNSDPDFHSSHWNEPNVLAHVRFNDRVGPNGEKLLHLEEVQSDWHQQGRDKGYNVPVGGVLSELTNMSDDALAALGLTRENVRGIDRVPNAPFKHNWHELVLKRMLRYAAEHGYHGISITPGEEQAKRYSGMDPEKADGLKKWYDTTLVNTLHKLGKKFGTGVGTIKVGQDPDVSKIRHIPLSTTSHENYKQGKREAVEAYKDGMEVYGIVHGSNDDPVRINTAKDIFEDDYSGFIVKPPNNRHIFPYLPLNDNLRQSVLHKGQALYKRKVKYAAAQPVSSLGASMAMSKGANQKSIVDIAKDIVHDLQLTPAIATDTVHISPLGTRPSLMVRFNHGGNTGKGLYATSWMGLMSQQPGMVLFNLGDGKDLLHTVHVQGSGHQISQAFKNSGVQDITMAPLKNGFRVVIYDKDSKLGSHIKQIANSLNGTMTSQRGSGEFVGHPDENKSRQLYRQVIRGYEGAQQSVEDK